MDARLVSNLGARDIELQTLEALQTGGSALVSSADHAAKVRPRPARSIALGLLLGIILGVGAAFRREALDTRVHSDEIITTQLDLHLLSLIPRPVWAVRRMRSCPRWSFTTQPLRRSASCARTWNLQTLTNA